MRTPTGYLPPNTAANMAHSTHSTQPALQPHRATPREEDAQNVSFRHLVFRSIPIGGGGTYRRRTVE